MLLLLPTIRKAISVPLVIVGWLTSSVTPLWTQDNVGAFPLVLFRGNLAVHGAAHVVADREVQELPQWSPQTIC